MKRRDLVELWTYGTYDEENDTDFGKSFLVPKKWLKDKINKMGYKTFKDFFEDYTWDTTITLDLEAELEGVLVNRKCGRFGHVIWSKELVNG